MINNNTVQTIQSYIYIIHHHTQTVVITERPQRRRRLRWISVLPREPLGLLPDVLMALGSP